MAHLGPATEKIPSQHYVGNLEKGCRFTPAECRSAVQSKPALPKSCLAPLVGCTTTNHASFPTA